mmetsp:Transcript_8146/g.15116  ORF Transcript_8146/g.15116 Transcript_8146/m.15116 type:complete len:355 (+) Transcript_8146:46-1110(+)
MGGVQSCVSGGEVPFKREQTGNAHGLGVAVAACQIPATKDEDRYYVGIGNMNTGKLTRIEGHHKCGEDGDVVCVGVYDGHGGREVAELLEKEIVARLLKRTSDSINSEPKDVKYRKVPESHITETYRDVHKAAVKKYNCGSCCINLFITNGKDGSRVVQCAWAGDSRASYFKGNRYKQHSDFSIDHSLERPEEKERIISHGQRYGGAYVARRKTREGYPIGPHAVFKSDPNKTNLSLMMTRSIGDKHHSVAVLADPEFRQIVVGRNEHVRLVVASDGMWRVYDNKVTSNTMKHTSDPSLAANRLAVGSVWRTQRHTHMRMDDVTVIVVDVQGADIGHSVSVQTNSPTSRNKAHA